jgi:2'-deoxynucleoside 5'-phosphate N-hydrolase
VPTTIYFSGSISSGRQDAALYARIVSRLREAGHQVIDGEVTAPAVHEGGGALDSEAIFRRDMAWLEEANVLVAEVSRPSTGVGYEIAAARYLRRIPVICLYRPAWTSRCSAMISGDAGIELIEYEEEGFETMIQQLLGALVRAGGITQKAGGE